MSPLPTSEASNACTPSGRWIGNRPFRKALRARSNGRNDHTREMSDREAERRERARTLLKSSQRPPPVRA